MNKYIMLIVFLVPSLATAVDETKINEWKGEGELGYTSTSGNTDSKSLNAKLGVEKKHEKWTHKAGLETLQASASGVKSADRATFSARSEYKFGEKAYAFGAIRYENDTFSGYDYQSSITFGVGEQFIKNESHELDASVGLGYREKKETTTGNVVDEGILTGSLNYTYIISTHATFKEKILFEAGDTNTYSESETSLKMKINGNLASKITYTVKNNSKVPAGTKKTDTITTVALVYGF